MQVSHKTNKVESSDNYSFWRRRAFFIILVAGIMAILIGIELSPKDIANYLKLKGFQGPAFKENPSEYVKSVPNELFSSVFEKHEINDLRIDIGFVDWRKISKYKDIALKNGIIGDKEKEYINASITYKGDKKKVKLRLKGDWTDHLLGDKLSFRIKVKNGKYIDGYKVMSLQNPQVRDFQGQILINEMLKEHNILVPRYNFVNVFVNGNNIGLMALTEHFSKELLEDSRRKESVIIKFDETGLWESRINKKIHKQNQNLSKIIAFQEKKIRKSDRLSEEYKAAIGLLRGFLEGKLSAEDVFDVKLMGEFLAIHDIWGETHAFIWHNVRYYYNPITAKLEPIAFDELLYHPSHDVPRGGLVNRVDNGYISLVYVNTLKTLKKKIEEGYLKRYIDLDSTYEALLRKEFWFKPPPLVTKEKLLKRIDFLLEQYSPIVHKKQDGKGWIVDVKNTSNQVNFYVDSSEKLGRAVKSNLYVNDFYMYGLSNLGLDDAHHGYTMLSDKDIGLNNSEDVNSTSIVPISKSDLDKFYKLTNVYLVNEEQPRLEIQSLIPYALKVKSILVTHVDGDKVLTNKTDLTAKSIIIQPLLSETQSVFETINIGDLGRFDDIKDVSIEMSLLGGGKSYLVKAERYSETINEPLLPKAQLEEQLRLHEYLILDEAKKTITIKKGKWYVKSPIVVPPGYSLIADEGTTLLFNEVSYIFSYGQISFIGSKEYPVRLASENSDQYWKGLKIYGNSELPVSVFKNVSISNITSLKKGMWNVNAGFFAHNINLIMDGVTIDGNKSEDAMNIVNSKFLIKNIAIKNAISDAIDSDYSTGEIIKGTFSNIGYVGGGDALDFSGSRVLLRDLSISNIDDKGISVGERSKINAKNINFSNLSVAVAVKDGSTLDISDIEISNARLVAIMAYTKKPAYGGGFVESNKVKVFNTRSKFKAGLGSTIIADGAIIRQEKINVEKLYKSVMKSGLKK